MNIGFIGIGNMAGAVIKGYLKSNPKHQIFATARNKEKLKSFCDENSIVAVSEIPELTTVSDIVFIAVKPKDMEEVIDEIRREYNDSKTLVSMAAGVTISNIEKKLAGSVVRIMPNTPALVNKGMTSYSDNGNVNKEHKEVIIEVINSVGRVREVPEGLIHAVIGASGSAPAFTYLYMKALMEEALEEGMSYEEAKLFVSQGVIGAATMLMKSEETPQQLVKNVCSPGGTTIQGVNYLLEVGFEEKVKSAVKAAVNKSKEMEK
ncbi:MAG: pyrroline-5-carboxylate reductase [Anaerovoracaceae bacterium]